MTSPIYLDYAATTPVDPRVAEVMSRYLTQDGVFGNPASDHIYGIAAAQAVDQARYQVAALLNAEPGEIIWTSGATEANNLALKGAMPQYRKRGRHLITCKTEHRAVLDVCRQLQQDGCQVTYLDPEPDGRLALDTLAAALRPDTVLVSLMHVNNELGVVHDLATIGRLTRERGVLLHVDAAQSAGKLPLDMQALEIDLLSLSAHKLYGPKGIGALYLRRRPRIRLVAQLQGGGQEQGLRAGTLATHQIVGMGEAFRLAQAALAADEVRIRALRDRLWQGARGLGGVTLNGHPTQCVAGILNLSFAGVTSEALRAALGDIAVSAGSACSSASSEPSHVLKALGLEPLRVRGAIRFSLGRFTTEADIDRTLERLRVAVQRLRALSPV
jgi:cysteine desulfurase